MFCHKCGKEIPDGARFCNFCGAEMPAPAPRHARPEPEEIYSHSDENDHSEFDVAALGIDQPSVGDLRDEPAHDATRVYDFSLFEEAPSAPASKEPEVDDRERIDDSFDNYTDEDDLTFMDKLDRTFRRDEDDHSARAYDNRRKQSRTWLWITLAVAAVMLVLIIVIAAVASGSKSRKDVKPTVAPTAATEQVTEQPTDEPAPTDPPATEAPLPTDPPATEAPAPTDPPATEAPAPTDPPVIDSQPDEPVVDSEPDTPVSDVEDTPAE